MRKLAFITSNKHKFAQVELVLKKYKIKLEHVAIDYPEDKEKEMKEISLEAAKNLAEKLNRPVIVEDTGLYFMAYNNFPGAQPKFVFNSLGFRGIFKLLEGENREAYFKSVIGYCEPGKEPLSFEGEMRGKIIDKVVLPEKDAMPYEHIFVADGYSEAFVEMDIELKNSFSQRGKATKKLGDYLLKK